MFYAGRLHTGTRDQRSRAQVVALEEGRWSSTVNQNLGTATCSKHRLGSATAHGLASCGGLVRLLAALRTPEVRLSRSDTTVGQRIVLPAARATVAEVSLSL